MFVPDLAAVYEAAALLRRGGLVAFATETVYGLGADVSNVTALKRVFAVKGRPLGHPLIVHIRDRAVLGDYAIDLPLPALRLAEAFWPGPLTLVLRRHPRVSQLATGGLDTVALRVPAHPTARALLDAFDGGIAAPSANRFGAVSPTTALHVRTDLGADVDLVLDGGACAIGVESTILDLSGSEPVVLRPGGVTVEALQDVLGVSIEAVARADVRAPGMLPSHYAPRARVVLASRAELPQRVRDESARGLKVALLGALTHDERTALDLPGGVVEVAWPADATGAASRLYAALREVDERGADVVICTPPGEAGLGRAVADRLRKAAGPRQIGRLR